MFFEYWVSIMACLVHVLGKACSPGNYPHFEEFLDGISKSGTCWDLEEEEIAINSDDIYSTLEDDSNPNNCSYNNEFANLICNNSPPAWVTWTAGGVIVAGTTLQNLPAYIDAASDTIVASRRLRATWRGELKREIHSLSNTTKFQYQETGSDWNITHHYVFDPQTNIIEKKGSIHNFKYITSTPIDIDKRDDALTGGNFVMVVSTGVTNWAGAEDEGCIKQVVGDLFGKIIYGNLGTFGCSQIYWGTDSGISRIPLHWTVWTEDNEEGEHNYHHLWGECCGADPDSTDAWDDINY